MGQFPRTNWLENWNRSYLMGQFQEQTGNREVGTDQYLMGQFPRTNWPEGGTDESLGQFPRTNWL